MTPKKLTPKQLEKELRGLKEDIEMSQTGLENCKSEEQRERYIILEKGYQKQLDDLIKQHPPKIKKVPIVYWTPESIGEIDESYFDKPYLTVSVQDSITERPTKDSIRMYWSIKDDRCEYLVEEKGYVVGVIKNVVIGVVQVSGWKRHEIKDGEKKGRVEFTGELLSDHPYIDYELTDRKVLGPIQYFNFPDDWTD